MSRVNKDVFEKIEKLVKDANNNESLKKQVWSENREEFVKKALDIIPNGNKVAMFMGIQFLEGKARRKFLSDHPIKKVYVSSSRLNCAKNGDFIKYNNNSARCYAWYIWQKGYNGNTELKWFN